MSTVSSKNCKNANIFRLASIFIHPEKDWFVVQRNENLFNNSTEHKFKSFSGAINQCGIPECQYCLKCITRKDKWLLPIIQMIEPNEIYLK